MDRYFINDSDMNYFISELGMGIDANNKKVITISEEKIERSKYLLGLINTKKLIEVSSPNMTIIDYNENTENVEEEPVSVVIGGAKQDIALNPDEYMNRGRTVDSSGGPVSFPGRNQSVIPSSSFFPKPPPNIKDFIKTASSPTVVPVVEENKQSSYSEFGSYKKPIANEVKEIKEEIKEETKVEVIKNQLELWWCGPANDAGGYGKMNRYCVELLHKMGVKVHLELFKIPDFRCSVPISDSMNTMINTVVGENCPSVWAIMPPKYLNRSGRKIIFTMMECNGVPKSFAEKCNNANELWLPSIFNMNIFNEAKANGLLKENVSLYHMPLGVDLDLYRKFNITEDQKNKIIFKTNKKVFLSVFGWSLRKGCDILFKSYLEEFTGDDDVTLLLVSRKDGSSSSENKQEISNQIREYMRRWNSDNPPHIVHVGDALPEEELPILYNLSDAFISESRGEGFLLPGIEAGACGIPLIVTRCGGQLDYVDDNNSFLVDIEGYDIGSQEIRSLSSYYEGQTFAVLGDEAVNQTRKYMRMVYNEDPIVKEKANKLYEDVHKNYSWDNLANKIHNRLKEIS